MVRETSDDPAIPAMLEEMIRRRQLVKKLMVMRACKGLSQAEIAARMGCSQGRISKFEASEDDDVRLGDVRKYLQAVGFDLQIDVVPHEVPCD